MTTGADVFTEIDPPGKFVPGVKLPELQPAIAPRIPHLGAILIGAALGAAACSTTGPTGAHDPYEPFNRRMYAFNDQLDRVVLEPVARGYREITTPPVRDAVTNFGNNLHEPVTFTNELLQLRPVDAASTATRFAINSVIGLAGTFEVAGALGLARTEEDFGRTLAIWGVAPGPYLVLPVLGPSDPRRLTGNVGDIWLNPLAYTGIDGIDAIRASGAAASLLSKRERAIDLVSALRETQLDPYAKVRRAYLANRDATQAHAGAPVSAEPIPDDELDF